MLKMYSSEKPNGWEDYLHLIEFSYNHSYHYSIMMSPSEAIYGRNCNTPLSWSNLVHKKWYANDNVQEMELTIYKAKANMKATLHRFKSWPNLKMSIQQFHVGDEVFVIIKPNKSSFMFGKNTKLSPCYCGPFKIINKIGNLAYEYVLPSQLSRIHNAFHVSILKKKHP